MSQSERKPVRAHVEAASAPVSALDGAAAKLRRLLAQGQLGSGQPLIEVDLAARLGVARSTVREALRRLESEGLVVARKRGLQVRRLSRSDVADLYDVREALEGLAARRGAEHLAAAARPARERLAVERRLWARPRGDFAVRAFSAQNRRFHDMVLAAAANSHLPRMLDQTLLTLFAAQFRPWLEGASIDHAAAEHVRILDALAQGSGPAAERTMRAHIRSSAETILALGDAAFD